MVLRRRIPLNAALAVLNHDHFAGFERLDSRKPKLNSATLSLAAANKRAILGVTQGPKSFRVAKDDHIAHRVQKHDIVSAIEFFGESAEQIDQIRTILPAMFVCDECMITSVSLSRVR